MSQSELNSYIPISKDKNGRGIIIFDYFSSLFTISDEYIQNLHQTIVDFMFYCESGAWDFHTLYNLPIPLRNYHVRRVNALIEERNAAIKKSRKQ